MIKKLSLKFSNHFRDFFVNGLVMSSVFPNKIRVIMLKLYGLRIGNNSRISPKCFFGGNKLTIGNNVFVNYDCFFDNLSTITIDDNVSVGMRVLFCTSTHEVCKTEKRAGKTYGKDISVGKGSWIGANVTILPGVKIGEGCIIASGSIVNSDCEPNSMYAGVPARKVKDLD
jgi:maltose O-acetyltransferase